VVGFLVRLSVLLLGANRRLLLLDETFAQLSAGYEPALAEWLGDVAEKAEVQLIMVSHSDAYAEHADTVYRTKLVSGITDFEEVHG